MQKHWIKFLLLAMLTLAFTGCTTLKGMIPFLGSGKDLGKVQKIETVHVIFDTTVTNGFLGKLSLSKQILSSLNKELNNYDLSTGLRIIDCDPENSTRLIYGIRKHSKRKFESAIKSVKKACGRTSLNTAIIATRDDLIPVAGNIALIIVSDGITGNDVTLQSVDRLNDEFGNRISIYTISTGDDINGIKLMNNIPARSSCGFSTTALKLISPLEMKKYVEKIIYGTVSGDSDGDGVEDSKDQCPNTPNGIDVDVNGCPPDSDGDGIYDYLDECNNTPKGFQVNESGCWNVKLYFDFNQYEITAETKSALNDMVEMLKNNTSLSISIEGHTDNVGTEAYNDNLSINRSRAVLGYLMKKGVSKSRVSIKGFGYKKPAAPNTTDQNRSLNRRVEVRFR